MKYLVIQYDVSDIRNLYFRNGERITKADRISVDNDLLHVKRITPNDNGVYRCSASNKAGSVLSLKNFALAIQSKLNCNYS